jgi:hypothetical protein
VAGDKTTKTQKVAVKRRVTSSLPGDRKVEEDDGKYEDEREVGTRAKRTSGTDTPQKVAVNDMVLIKKKKNVVLPHRKEVMYSTERKDTQERREPTYRR